MISESAAREVAHRALSTHLDERNPLLASWAGLEVSGPRLVSDLNGLPSYWIVPLVCGPHAVGFVRVLSDGVVAAIGVTCRTPETPEACPKPDFTLTAEEVERKFGTEVRLLKGETASPPRLVHDGPIGRETWLIETYLNGLANRWIFVGRAGTYERNARVIPGADADME